MVMMVPCHAMSCTPLQIVCQSVIQNSSPCLVRFWFCINSDNATRNSLTWDTIFSPSVQELQAVSGDWCRRVASDGHNDCNLGRHSTDRLVQMCQSVGEGVAGTRGSFRNCQSRSGAVLGGAKWPGLFSRVVHLAGISPFSLPLSLPFPPSFILPSSVFHWFDDDQMAYWRPYWVLLRYEHISVTANWPLSFPFINNIFMFSKSLDFLCS